MNIRLTGFAALLLALASSRQGAGHMITRPYVPTFDVREVRIHPITKRPNVFGGTPEGQARANQESWQKLVAFLEKYLAD